MSAGFKVIFQFRGQTVFSSDRAAINHYSVQVVHAPGRGWGGPMVTSHVDANKIRAVRTAYRGFVARQQARREPTGDWAAQPMRAIGDELFSVLPESVQERLQQAQAYATGHNGHLHIILNFELSAVDLLDLPWELLHDPNGRFFYSLRGGGISRCVLMPAAPAVDKPVMPKTILGCWAEPQGTAPLVERQGYAPAHDKLDGITWVQGPNSIRRLQQALDTGTYDGLHLVAHGRVGSAWDYAIALEDENGRPHWISPDQLTVLLSQYPSIRFVYLDVCSAGDNLDHNDLAAAAVSSDATPGGAAGQLLGIGVSVVIIMQDRISQMAAGLMANCFYREMGQGASIEMALTTARRAVQLQQGDMIHWSVPALYTQRSVPQIVSPLADWILDEVTTPAIVGPLLAGLNLVIVIGFLSHQLSQVVLSTPGTWRWLTVLLAACCFIPILAAAVTTRGQAQLADKYGYHGRSWIPFLWHKYFSAFIWTMISWVFIWLVWLGIYGAGGQPAVGGRQLIWLGSLTLVALTAHIGARQAVRQDLLFRRIGFSLFKGGLQDAALMIILLLIGPYLPLLLAWGVWLIWTTLGGNSQVIWGLIWLVFLVLVGAFLSINRHS